MSLKKHMKIPFKHNIFECDVLFKIVVQITRIQYAKREHFEFLFYFEVIFTTVNYTLLLQELELVFGHMDGGGWTDRRTDRRGS